MFVIVYPGGKKGVEDHFLTSRYTKYPSQSVGCKCFLTPDINEAIKYPSAETAFLALCEISNKVKGHYSPEIALLQDFIEES